MDFETDALSTRNVAQGQRVTQAAWWSRPRFLFAITFAWLSITGGRFLAPYLENKNAPVGVLLASQQATGLLAGPWAGRVADQLEFRFAGAGRISAVAIGVLIGTLCTVAQDLIAQPSITVLLLIRVLYAIASSFTIPIVDAIGVEASDDYGRERLWGAVAWATCHVVLGPLLDQYGFRVFYPLSSLLGTLSVGALILYLKSNAGPYETVEEHTEPANDGSDHHCAAEPAGNEQMTNINTESEVTTWKLFRTLVVGGSNTTTSGSAVLLGITFLVAVAFMGAGQAIVDNLIFLYFEFLGSSYTIMGITVVLTVLFEIPIFHVSDQLLHRFGANLLLQAAMICYVVRVIGYSLLPSGHASWTLFLEPLHGITYACSQTAIVDLCTQRAPVGYAATFQGFVFSVRSIGAIVGLYVGGRAEENWSNPRLLYLLAAASVGCVSLLLAVVSSLQVITKEKMPHRQRSSVELTENTCRESFACEEPEESNERQMAEASSVTPTQLTVAPIS